MNFLLHYDSSEQVTKTLPNDLENKIYSFLNLPNGWYFGDGVSPTRKTINNALRIGGLAQSFSLKTDAFPGVKGEIEIACIRGNDILEFVVNNDNITFDFERNNEEIEFTENLSVNEALGKLSNYGKNVWNISDTLNQSIITVTVDDSAVEPFKIPPVEAEAGYPLSRSVA